MSSEPKSTIQDPQELEDFRSLAGIPSEVDLILAGDRCPESCPEDYFVIYEYPFKIGLRWPYSPLPKAFMSHFEIAPGQLMPQFWRVLQVIERVTKDWDAPFDVIDLLTAYIVKPDKHHRYSLFSRARGDKILVQNTQVNDRQWKVRYAFARILSFQPDDNWRVPSWNNQGITMLYFFRFSNTILLIVVPISQISIFRRWHLLRLRLQRFGAFKRIVSKIVRSFQDSRMMRKTRILTLLLSKKE